MRGLPICPVTHSLLFNHDRRMGVYAGIDRTGDRFLDGQLCVEIALRT